CCSTGHSQHACRQGSLEQIQVVDEPGSRRAKVEDASAHSGDACVSLCLMLHLLFSPVLSSLLSRLTLLHRARVALPRLLASLGALCHTGDNSSLEDVQESSESQQEGRNHCAGAIHVKGIARRSHHARQIARSRTPRMTHTRVCNRSTMVRQYSCGC